MTGASGAAGIDAMLTFPSRWKRALSLIGFES
jgi:hypothetical protein